MMHYTNLQSPIGRLMIAGDDSGLRHVIFQGGKKARAPGTDWTEKKIGVVDEAASQLEAYFEGGLREFDLPLKPAGTPFRVQVWRALLEIPYGETITYGELARMIGRPKASRAVGAANGANPIPVIIPCHRVIGVGGKLTGYGGGLEIKEALLLLETKHAPSSIRQPVIV